MAKKEITIVCDLEKKKWLTEKEAAIYLGVGSPMIFRDWRENHGLKHYRPTNKNILYKRTDLDAFIEQSACEINAIKQRYAV